MKFLDVPQSGSIADRTHSHNRAGQYTRNRRAPVQPVGTGRRAAVRAAFAAASAGWAALTDVQRAGWTSFADSHPITDSLGQNVVLTGHQMYVRVTASRVNVGLEVTVDVPVDLSLPDVSAASFAFDVVTGIAITGATGDAGDIMAIAFSQPFSAGRSFNKTFWQPPSTAGYSPIGDLPFAFATSAYAAQFGTPNPGQRVFARLTPVSSDGWNGAPVIVSTIVTP